MKRIFISSMALLLVLSIILTLLPTLQLTVAAAELETSETVSELPEEPETELPEEEITASPSDLEELPVSSSDVEEAPVSPSDAEEVLPYGFAGMPEDYVLSEAELADKLELNDGEIVETLASLVAGEDYVENEILFTASSEEQALLTAAAYSAELKTYSYKIAIATLKTATVLEAVSAAADMGLPLLAVAPNYITKCEEPPVVENKPVVIDEQMNTFSLAAPTKQSWQTWLEENLVNPDPYIDYNVYDSDVYNNYQWMHDAVNTYEAWGVTTGNPVVKVAVIDTGVDSTHEDLAGHVEMIDIGRGTVDVDSHGTHVAGIIGAALDNGVGGAGIAPGVSILGICAANFEDYGYDEPEVWFEDADLARAIYAATDSGAWIINMSLGGYFLNPILQEAIDYAYENGVTIIAAMGNDGTNAVNYPAACNNVIAVAATDQNSRCASFSTYGTWADVAAPGENILSTVPGDGYSSYNGTSMATPVVSGVAALYMSVYGHVTPAEMEKKLETCVNRSGSTQIGSGIVDASKLFSSDKTAPYFYAIDHATGEERMLLSGKSYTLAFTEEVYISTENQDDNELVLYTIDGKTPSVRNGLVVNGLEYSGGNVTDYPYGKSTTIKTARVSGMGVLSKVSYIKVTRLFSTDLESISINGPASIIAGKSASYTATALPDYANQSVIWSIDSCSEGMRGMKINSKTGTLTTTANIAGIVTIKASSTVSSVSATMDIQIKTVKPVRTITLDMTKLKLSTVDEPAALSVVKIVDTAGTLLELSDISYTWTSSNKKVVTVDENGIVTPVGKGSATVYFKALDGSKKTAKCTVTVIQLVESLTVSGLYSIAPGAYTTFKATALPANASSKSVTWSLSDAPEGVTVSRYGTVKVPSGTAIDSTFSVIATAVDGSGVTGSWTVNTAPKCRALYIDYNSDNGDYRPVLNRYGTSVVSVLLYTIDRNTEYTYIDWETGTEYCYDNNEYDETSIDLFSYNLENTTPVKWTSSKPSVATVSEDGFVKALKAGSTTITCAARDGSGKKQSVKITVVVPVSTMKVSSSIPYIDGISNRYIGVGRSATNKVSFGDLYGIPTNKRVSWQIDHLSCSGYVSDEYGNYDIGGADLPETEYKKLVTLSSSGTLTVKSGFKSVMSKYESIYEHCEFNVLCYALSSDGTYVSDSIVYTIVPSTTTMKFQPSTEYCYYDGETYGYNSFFTSNLYSNGSGLAAATITSSNPKVVTPLYVYDNCDGTFEVDYIIKAKGTARLTVKAADGSGKYCTLTVKVS